MPITPRFFGERGRRRAISLGIEPERLPPGQSPTVSPTRPTARRWNPITAVRPGCSCPICTCGKSAKWIQRLEILEADALGFWEQNGYHHCGDPWQQERHSVDDYVALAMRRRAREGARD